jgi:membrane associated rhomboid family serine protease
MASFSPRRSGGPFGGGHGQIVNLPDMTKMLVIANLAIHLLRQFIPASWDNWLVLNFAFVPARFTNFDFFEPTTILTPLTAQFLHGGWMHVLMNMLMMMIFGTAVERAIGGRRMVAVGLLAGALGLLLHFAVYFGEVSFALGFSGVTSGLFGATLRLMSRQRGGTDSRQIWVFAALWVGLSLLPAIMGLGIAWAVHVGGFLAGLLLIDSFDRRGRFRIM